MSAAKRKMTPQEYLAFERAAETKHEYYDGDVFAMAGTTYGHTVIKDNLAGELRDRFKGGPCVALTSDLRVKVDATGLYTYPDVTILCGEGEFEDDELDTLLNPTAIVEVLSDSTERYDRGKKFLHYQRIPSIREYVLVSQNEMVIERFVRQPDNTWVLASFFGPDAVFSFKMIRGRVPLADIYRGAFKRKRAVEPSLSPQAPAPPTSGRKGRRVEKRKS